jgi:predicted ATP-binding protein involved in virulence
VIVRTLSLEQYRGFDARASINFDPRWTVVVGENGVGKTSVLWALRVLLSHILARAKAVKKSPKPLRFLGSDVAGNWPYLRAELSVSLSTAAASGTMCIAQKHREPYVPSEPRHRRSRDQIVHTPDTYKVSLDNFRSSRSMDSGPLVVYYSANRYVASHRGPSKEIQAARGTGVAYAEALADRQLSLGEAALLWRKEAVLEKTDGAPARANRAIEAALPVFLGDFHNMRTEGANEPRLVVDKGPTTLDLSQLSDGERGLLALLIDLTRRLTIANPTLANPAREGHAVVLIDELDLHMHPRWQRLIVSELTAMFPRCQFIATTHSPQIISELQPEWLLLLRKERDQIAVQKCGQSYGLDTHYVLEHIMGTTVRPGPAMEAIRFVEDALDAGDLQTARDKLQALRELLHGDDVTVVSLEATINNLEALTDATDSEED